MPRRRYRSSDDDEEPPVAYKRRRGSEPLTIEQRLESLITRVGEKSSSSLESNLETLADVLEADLSSHKQKIIQILCSCVVSMPEKLCIYTTLVGLLNLRDYKVGGEIVESLVRNLRESLKKCEFSNTIIIVRFLSDLVNCHVVGVASILSLFTDFFEVSLEENIPQVRSDVYVHAVLASLPWVGQELFEKKEMEFNKLIRGINGYIGKRYKIHTPALRVWASDEPHPQEEYLDCLWAQIMNLQAANWLEKQIIRPYRSFEVVLSESLHHNLPQVIPPPHDSDTAYPLPYIIFRMFDYTDVPEGPVLPGSHAIERYLIEEQINRIIHTSHKERKDCAAALLSFPVRNRIPVNYMVVETLFGHLFRLPVSDHLEIFYGSLLIELCKLQPGSMPQVLAQATEMLFERLDTMNVACIERFSSWFAYHLSNFQYRWSWSDWADVLEVHEELPKPKFVREVLYKCLRLTYWERLKDVVPENFEPLLPRKPLARYKFDQAGASSLEGTMVAHKLVQAIRAKCTPEEVVIILKELPNPIPVTADGCEPGFNPLKIDTFVQSLLHLASKSFSYSFAAIAKFHVVLQGLCPTEEAQICLLKSIYELWSDHKQMLCVLIDKLLRTQVIRCSAVANWVFSSEMSKDFTSFYVWEIVHSTIKKINKHVARLQKDIDDARDKRSLVEQRTRDGTLYMDEEPLEAPSEEMIERMEERFEAAQSEQKNLFLIVFQRFIIALTEHLSRCELQGVEYSNPWYKWAIERLQQVFLQHHEQVYRYIATLEGLLFTSDIDVHVLLVFQQFCALRS